MAARRKTSRRSASGRRGSPALRRRLRAIHAYTAPLAAWLAAVAVAIMFFCLHVIGPPPMLRIDALWVNEHRAQVYAALGAGGAALAATIPAALYRRNRLAMLILWSAAIVLAATAYANRVDIIWRVVWHHM